MKWKDKLTLEQRTQVEKELREFGLDQRQINSLMNYHAKITELELILMRDMPDTPRGRPTIGSIKAAIQSCKLLGLIERNPNG